MHCRYEKEKKPLGEGTYGTVYRAKDKMMNRLVAMKKVRVHGSILLHVVVALCRLSASFEDGPLPVTRGKGYGSVRRVQL